MIMSTGLDIPETKYNRTEQILFRCQKTHKHKLRFFFTFCNCSNRQLRRDQWSSSQATAQIQILCMVKLAIV